MSKNHKKCQNVLELTPNFGQNEQGRSMVEMLGVLAVVGVLSIGAISGYRYAMNKYRANQVTNELNLLSHQVAIAMMSKNGVTELKLDEPYETNKKLTSAGYSFEFGCGDGTTPDCGGKYYFNVQDVSEGVCKELVQMSEHMQFLKTRTDTCSAGNNALNFVFELPDGMSSGASGNDGASEGFDESKLPTALDTTCSGAGTWNKGNVSCECESDYAGLYCERDACSSGKYWDPIQNQCVAACADGKKNVTIRECVSDCTSNDTCAADEYCYLKLGYGTYTEFNNSYRGTCRKLSTDAVRVGDYIISKIGMTWWSAKRFCDRMNRNLVTLDDFGCTESECRGVDYSGIKNAGLISLWTETNDGSYASRIYLDGGYVFEDSRSYYYGAVCK